MPAITMLTAGMPNRHTFPRDPDKRLTDEDLEDKMSSFINTMFVPNSPPQPYSPSPQPLPALHSNILAESESYTPPRSPQETYKSPLQRHLHNLVSESNTTHSTSKLPVRAQHVESRTHDVHRGQQRGLGGRTGRDVAKQADLLTYSNNNARTRNQAFQPQKRAKGTTSWQLKQFAEATLGSGSLRKVVKLPEGEDRDEWLAVNVVDFYNQINLLYGAITEFCSPHSCPEMKATDEFEYLWQDPPTFPKPTRLPAPTYISHLLTWTSQHLSNPSVFPTQPGVPFPEGFEKTVKLLFKRLYRIYAHIYCHHYSVVRGLGLEAHLNTGFKHYVLFVEEFDLADGKGGKNGEWFGPLGELVESMLRSD